MKHLVRHKVAFIEPPALNSLTGQEMVLKVLESLGMLLRLILVHMPVMFPQVATTMCILPLKKYVYPGTSGSHL
jgi:hypothetical protein